MRCPHCQSETPADAEFCPECGGKLQGACGRCGTANAPGHKFCKKCGQPLGPSRGPEPEAARFGAPGTYTPRHLAEKILTARPALEGERKQVTVLFADLRGSLELLADRDPEEARKILDPVLELMMEAVHRYEGTVNQVMGDGIMALFGAPVAHEDHAVRACYAALRMQETLRQAAEEARRTLGVEIRIRVGINSGEVVVRSIGSDLRMDYTAVGQTTHLAARMEQLAAPGTIRVTADTARLAEGYIRLAPLGPIPVKGLAEAVEVYEVTGAGPVRTRVQATAARGLSRFVGRQAELGELRRALGRAGAGHGQVVAVVGEAGVGKSRLLHEFTRSVPGQEWLILESGSVSYGRATSYLPVLDLLKAYFKILDRDGEREIREKLTGKLLALDRALEPTLPAFLALLGVPAADSGWQALDPAQRRQRTLDAVKGLLLRESRAQPLLLVFEDLHWIDTETQALLDGLVESLPTAPVLLVVNYRPEYQHGWGSKTYYLQLRLDALPPATSGELLEALLGGDPELGPLKELLATRAAGNPLFLEEGVRDLVETGGLRGERGRYRLGQPVRSIRVPATVQAILASRIDRLPTEDKQLLQCAAVVGTDVRFQLLQAVADAPEVSLRAGLAHLQSAELLYETSLFPDLEYTFKHALTHEVAYASLLQHRRRELHARIGLAMERLDAERLAERAEALAHHFTHAEAWDKVVSYARQAGDRAAALCADGPAVELYERALVALGRLPASREVARFGIDLRLALRAPLWRAGRLDRLGELFKEVEALATRYGETAPLDTVYAFFTQYWWAKGDHEQAAAYGHRCLEIGEGRDDLGLRVTAHFYLGHAYQSMGRFPEALEHYRRNMALLEGLHEAERFGLSGLPYSGSCAYAALCLIELGAPAEALGVLDRGGRAADAAGHLYSQTVVAIYRGVTLARLGRLGEAIPLLERAAAVCREKRFVGQTMMAQLFLAEALALSGRAADGIPLVEQSIELQERANAFSDRAEMLHVLGGVCLGAGQLDRAESTAALGLDFARRQKERSYEGWIRLLEGLIAEERGDLDGAADHVAAARSIATPLGLRPLLARCHLALGRLRRRSGQPEAAREELRGAVAMFREMAMALWLERAEAELAAVGD